jgi:hypothetical protein
MSSFVSSENLLGPPKRTTIYEMDFPTSLVEFDATITATHAGSAIATDHPVEDGVDITDHIRREHERLTIDVVVSDHPIVIARSLNALPAVANGDPDSRAGEAYEFVRFLMDQGILVHIETRLRSYDNFYISSVTTPDDAARGRAVFMTIEAREILIATTELVAAPEPAAPERKRKTQAGKKPKAAPTTAVETKSTSLLNDAFTSVGRAFGG